MLHIIVWAKSNKSVVVGWTNVPIINYRDQIIQGKQQIGLRTGNPNPRGTLLITVLN